MKTKKIVSLCMLTALVFSSQAEAKLFTGQMPELKEKIESSSVEEKIKPKKKLIPIIKPKFAEYGKPRALDFYWEKIAWCETHTNWQDGGRYAGGLGIMTSSTYGKRDMGTWERWGGEEFAESPDKATREEQIIVANRVSTQGWYQPDGNYKPPVGFNGWGCAKRYSEPQLFTKSPYNIFMKKFQFGEISENVKVLQRVIGGLRVDGIYGPKTFAAHSEFIQKYGLLILAEYSKYHR